MNKIQNYLALSLISFIFISKEIIIIDEETIVLITFIAFTIFLSKAISEMVIDTLKERADKIESSYNRYYILHLYKLLMLIRYYRIQSSLTLNTATITTSLSKEMDNLIASGDSHLKNQITRKIKSILQTVENRETALAKDIESGISNAVVDYVSTKNNIK